MATMHDVARAAGVSLKTVSRVVNSEQGVRPETAARVQAAIAGLGFRPNAVARSLRVGQSLPLLGLVIGDLANPFYSAIARGVEHVAAGHGFLVIIGSSEERANHEQDLISTLVRQHITGMLVVPAGDRARSEHEVRIPTVFLDRPAPSGQADSVLLDNRGGAQRAVAHLISAGHRRIGVIGGEPALYSITERVYGYREALTAAGLPIDGSLVLPGSTVELSEAAAYRLLDLDKPPTAILALNNRGCVGVLRAVAARRATTAVLGIDDLELAALLPALHALVIHDPIDMGRVAAQLLFDRLAGDESPWRTVVLPTTLVIYDRGTQNA